MKMPRITHIEPPSGGPTEYEQISTLRARVAELEAAARDAIRCNDKGCMHLHPNFCPAQCQADAALRAVLRLSGNKEEVRK